MPARNRPDDTMTTLFERLTFRHFLRGWSVFWRMNLPFWIELGHAAAAVGLMILLQSYERALLALGRIPGLAGRPLAVFAGGSLLLFGLLWPLFRPVSRRVGARVESDFWRSQFMLVAALNRFSRALSALLAALAVFLAVRWGWLADAGPVARALVGLLLLTLVSVLALFLAFYGWLVAQWKELEEKRAPGH